MYLRILLHPDTDGALLSEVQSILELAVYHDPAHYDFVVGVPSVVDHFGYHDDTRSAVVLSSESRSVYVRLTIRDIYDSTHTKLRAAVARAYGLGQ